MAIPSKKFTEDNALDLYQDLMAKAKPMRTAAEEAFLTKLKSISIGWNGADPDLDDNLLKTLKGDYEKAYNSALFQSKGKASFTKKISYAFSKKDMEKNKYLAPVPGGGSTGALHIPQYKRALSKMNAYVWKQSMGRHKMGFFDFSRIRNDMMPIDAFDNVDNVVKSVDLLFQKTGLHSKIQALNSQIQASADQVNKHIPGGAVYSLDDAKAAAAGYLQDFAKDNYADLNRFKFDVAEIKNAVSQWRPPTYKSGKDKEGNIIEGGAKGSMYQAITAKHKAALLDYLEDMENVADSLQDVQTSEITPVIENVKDKKDLSFALNRFNAMGADAELRIRHYDSDNDAQEAIEEREGLSRMLVCGVYPKSRNNNKSQILKVDANYESLLDVNGIQVADKMEGENGYQWDVSDDKDLAASFRELVENNLLHEALYLVDEIKFRAGYPNAGGYKSTWIGELEPQLINKGNDYYDEAFEKLKTRGAKSTREGGGSAPILWRGFGLPLISTMMGKKSAGKRWLEEFHTQESFYWRIAERFKGTNIISNPAHGMGISHLIARGKDAGKYMLGGFHYKQGPKNGERTDGFAFLGVSNVKKDAEGNKVKTKKNEDDFVTPPKTIIPYYHRKFMYPVRLAARWSGVAPAYTLSMRYFGNALIALNLLALPALHLAEEAIEHIPLPSQTMENGTKASRSVGDYMRNADVASRILGAEIAFVDGVAWMGSQVGDGARWVAGTTTNYGLEALDGTFLENDFRLDDGVLWGDKTEIHDYTGAVFEWADAFNKNVIGDRGGHDLASIPKDLTNSALDKVGDVTEDLFGADSTDALKDTLNIGEPSDDDNADSTASADKATSANKTASADETEEQKQADREKRLTDIHDAGKTPVKDALKKAGEWTEDTARKEIGDAPVNVVKKGAEDGAEAATNWFTKTRDHLRGQDGATRAAAAFGSALLVFPLNFLLINRISGKKDATGEVKGFVNKTLKAVAIAGLITGTWQYLKVDPSADLPSDGKDKQEQKSLTPEKLDLGIDSSTSSIDFNNSAPGDLNAAIVALENTEPSPDNAPTFVQGGNNFLPSNDIASARMDYISADGKHIPYSAEFSGLSMDNSDFNGPTHV